MIIRDGSMDQLREIVQRFGTQEYRVSGLTAVNLYGYGIGTNVYDISVESDEAVFEAVNRLGLPEAHEKNFDPYIWRNENGDDSFYIRIQGDIMGEPVIHPASGAKLHSKELLLRKLNIYAKYSIRCLDALAFIALTLDDEKTEKYRYYWNRL